MSTPITPDLIPHDQFHKGSWLLPVDRPDWYYFVRQRNTNNIKNDLFINSVDKPLRPLVRWLHKRGIKTTPSCSGHHISERSLENIYEDLKKDSKAIRNGELELKDIETGEIICYQNHRYALPWSRSDFLRKAVVYQTRGVLGMRLASSKKIKQQIREIEIPGVSITEKEGILFVFTDNNAGNNGSAWKEVTKKIKAIVGSNI